MFCASFVGHCGAEHYEAAFGVRTAAKLLKRRANMCGRVLKKQFMQIERLDESFTKKVDLGPWIALEPDFLRDEIQQSRPRRRRIPEVDLHSGATDQLYGHHFLRVQGPYPWERVSTGK